MDEAAAQIAALKNQMEQTVRFVDDLKTYTESAAQAAESAEAMSASMTALILDADALQKNAASLQKDAAKLQKNGTSKVKSTVDTSAKQLASLALPYVQQDLARALDLYDQTRNQAQNSGYDLRPEGMRAVTVYIIRTDLQ